MDRDELRDRTRQFLTARLDALRYRVGHNFEVGVCDGSAQSLGRFFFTPEEIPAICASLKRSFPDSVAGIVARAENICRHRFDLLGYEDLDYGAEIDWHMDIVHGKRGPGKPWYKIRYLDFGEVGDAKITWELNRHQHFVTLAKAFRLSGEERFAREIFAQWAHWRKKNPYPVGINWASSLEVAYRSLSWIWMWFLLGDSPLFTSELRRQWLNAVNLGARHIETYLSTYFSPNTHLLGEALALFFIGTLFPGLSSSARWRERGWKILGNEALKQIREDGFYFEQSTYYHVYALDIFLHARILAAVNGIEISPAFDQILEGMLKALCLLASGGTPPSLGDDDGGRLFDGHRNRAEHMLDPLATGAVLYRRGDCKFAAPAVREETLWLLGVNGLAAFESLPRESVLPGSSAMPASGLYMMKHEQSAAQLLIDAGPLGAGSGGHGHADALSVCLTQAGKSLLIDPGTLAYTGDSCERSRLRGTGAHNTMKVDGRDQAEQAGPFAWEEFPQVRVAEWINGHRFDLFRGSHNGYSRLASPVIHHRSVFHQKGEFWMVRDFAEGDGWHRLDIAWHIGPGLRADFSDHGRFSDGDHDLKIIAAGDERWSRSVREEEWSPAYGKKDRSTTIHYTARLKLSADFATILSADEKVTSAGRLLRIAGSVPDEVCGYRYLCPPKQRSFFFAPRPQPWALGSWASDADFLYCSVDRQNRQYTLILCNATQADFRGVRVVNCALRVKYAEIISSAGKLQMFSSDRERIVLEQPLDRLSEAAECAAQSHTREETGA
jgi:Heparinase II/III-like protein/Heparinase II/III N-terminus